MPFDRSGAWHDALSVDKEKARPSLTGLAAVVARDANLTFGGGTATSEVLRRSLIKRLWIDDADHRSLYALSRLTPGTNLLAYCTGIGWVTRGPAGATVAWLASSVPAAIVSLGARSAYAALSASRVLSVIVLIGMTIAVLLLASSAWHLARPLVSRAGTGWSATVITISLITALSGWSPFQVLAISALLGALWHR